MTALMPMSLLGTVKTLDVKLIPEVHHRVSHEHRFRQRSKDTAGKKFAGLAVT